jgi:inosine-uridine nucleoside N-ribohydrolase
MTSNPIIIDTDLGADDAVAICYALKRCSASWVSLETSRPSIIGITTVFGNVTVAQATKNVKTILAVFQADEPSEPLPPVFLGADGPLLRPDETKIYGLSTYAGYGTDGIGGCTDPGASHERICLDGGGKIPTEAEHAASFLVRAAREHKGRLTLVALGPLTNVALACRLDPEFISNLSSLVVMGGSVLAMGNMSRTAEFNFFLDPEAARIVFSATSKPSASAMAPKVLLGSMEACEDHAFDWPFYDSIRDLKTPFSEFFSAFTRDIEKHCRNLAAGSMASAPNARISAIVAALTARRAANFLFNPWDLFAMVPALDPDMLVGYVDADVQIGIEGEARGMCATAWSKALLPGEPNAKGSSPPNTRIMTDLDRNRMRKAVLQAYGPKQKNTNQLSNV